MSLLGRLLKYNKEVYPMHMPGHKGGRYRLIDDVYKIDVTEVPETDHLYDATGILKSSMERLSRFYHTKKTFYLVNGSTVGVLSAIGGTNREHDYILVARNCHQSVYHAITLFKLRPVYIYPKMTQVGLVGGISPEEVKKLLVENKEITSFVMTSPTYDGFISDVGKIQEICKRMNVILIVDEAHGAHLPFTNLLPKSAVELGVDIVIHSMHKMLPVFTQSGLLHLNLPKDLENSVIKRLQMLQTSSPSYIMMAQMDLCVKKLGFNKELWTTHLDLIKDVNNDLRNLKKLHHLKNYHNSEEGVYASDPYKSIILVRGLNTSGHEVSRRLRTNYKIQMELSSISHCLGIFSVADSKKALKYYTKVLLRLDRRLKNIHTDRVKYSIDKKIKQVMLPCEAFVKESKLVKLDEAMNHTSAIMVTPYPPGIPVLVPGEEISESLITQLQEWEKNGVDLLGYSDGMIEVIKS